MRAHDSEAVILGETCDASTSPLPDLIVESRQDYIEEAGNVLLVGCQSESSGSMAFPAREFCPVSGARDMKPMTFGPEGILYSYSKIHVSSSRPTPYTIGYVDFRNGLRVLAHIRNVNDQDLTCNIPVELKSDDQGWFVSPISHQGSKQ
ncbi:Zn-ribbon domain-containing OB-fold protein [Granulosicoccus sp. 3-233]|uniref:Zn-ribbon domain-containing OB-fold protein n=1 Tax=Granulosicoccus sp. 3-233 TaxID=3417969 RepID=UPI003D33B91B